MPETAHIDVPEQGAVAEVTLLPHAFGRSAWQHLEALRDAADVLPLDRVRWLVLGAALDPAHVRALLGPDFAVVVRDASAPVSPTAVGRFEARSTCFSCGPGWFGWLTLEVGPAPDGGVHVDVDADLSRRMRASASPDGARSIWDAVIAGVRRGALAGDPSGRLLRGARVTVIDAKYHDVDARPDAYGRAALAAVDLALRSLPLSPPLATEPTRPPLALEHTKAWQLP